MRQDVIDTRVKKNKKLRKACMIKTSAIDLGYILWVVPVDILTAALSDGGTAGIGYTVPASKRYGGPRAC